MNEVVPNDTGTTSFAFFDFINFSEGIFIVFCHKYNACYNLYVHKRITILQNCNTFAIFATHLIYV